MEWSVPPYFEGCGVIIARVHVISVPLARMEFWHMEAPYAKVNRPLTTFRYGVRYCTGYDHVVYSEAQ